MPDLFSGLTGALTAARTGQLQGQNQGALTNFAIQMQLAELARQQRTQDIADRAEQARAGYYTGLENERTTQQRRADALAGIRPQAPLDPNVASGAADLGIDVPQGMQETGVGTGAAPGAAGVLPLTQLGKNAAGVSEVYDPTQNLQRQMEQDRMAALLERARIQQEGANSRTNIRVNQGPSGVKTSDAGAFGRIVTQQTAIYSKTHPGPVSGINEPALPPAQAVAQALIDAATVYPDEALRRYPNNPAIQAAAARSKAARGQATQNFSVPGARGGRGMGGFSGTFNPNAPEAQPGPAFGSAPAGQLRQGHVSAAVADIVANPEHAQQLDTVSDTFLTAAEKDEVRRQLKALQGQP